MRTTATLVVALLSLLLLGADAAEDNEVTKNPGLLVLPTARVSDLTVYGVKLGDGVDKIPASAGVTRQPLQSRPQDAVYSGANVWYYAHDGIIYRIKVHGEVAKQMPPYDTARLQMALGKADESITDADSSTTCLRFFARHIQYTVHNRLTLPVVTSVDLYAP